MPMYQGRMYSDLQIAQLKEHEALIAQAPQPGSRETPHTKAGTKTAAFIKAQQAEVAASVAAAEAAALGEDEETEAFSVETPVADAALVLPPATPPFESSVGPEGEIDEDFPVEGDDDDVS